jgi:6-phosphogluconolactonase (cycloisomerase 2 family)
MTQGQGMPNLNAFGTDKISLLPYAKSVGYAVLFSSMFFSTSQLYAGNGPYGPGPHHRGPGPGYLNQNGHDGENYYDVKNLAYYGDWDSNRVFIINVDDMSLLKTVEGTGDGPYGVDQQDASTAYALTRKTESLTVIENYYIENIGKIFLEHKPRSTNFNPDTGFSLVSGADKVMTSIIKVNSDKVTNVFGYDELAEPHDFGGSLATGHPLWVDDKRFFMLDRAERQIQLWSRRGGLLSVINTPTSVHHIFQSPSERNKEIYYAVVEGNRGEYLSPSILRFKIRRGKMIVTGEAVLSDYDPTLLNPAEMGSHHADFHPDGVHIYIGSAEGHVFVVNKNSMKIVTMIETGMGSGHTTFVPMHKLAFITNHNDIFMTVIDTTDHSWLKKIKVASSASPDYKSQSHTSGVSPDMMYFYSAASHDGVFFEIDVETLEISRQLNLELEINDDVNVLMGSFIWDGDGDNM